MYIPDMVETRSIRCVGYLSGEHDYATGNTPDPVFDALAELVLYEVTHPFISWCGYHDCDLGLCGLNQPQPELYWRGMVIPRQCSHDIFVPGGAVVYQAPALILHYIRAHSYLPPPSFTDAVLRRPDVRSTVSRWQLEVEERRS
jgi:hypothetical protein